MIDNHHRPDAVRAINDIHVPALEAEGKTYAGLARAQVLDLLSDARALDEFHKDTGVGVMVQFNRVHAPSPTARTQRGRGATLCGYKGVRGERVTCKLCQRILAGGRQ